MDPGEQPTSAYILGHAPAEHQRLLAQAERLRSPTRRFLLDAGIAPGMRVLDLGCGLGDVALILAEIVGPGGAVVGLDREERALGMARERAAEQRLSHVQFIAGDVTALDASALGVAFDAVIGRCILGHLDDPGGALRDTVRRVRPGGIVAFQGMDSTLSALTIARSRLPLLQRVHDWLVRGHAAAGKALPHEMDELPRAFLAAGLPAPQLAALTEIGVGEDAYLLPYLALTMRGLLPLYTRLGTLTPEEVDIDTLEGRLRAEVRGVQPDAVLAMWSLVGAWARLP